MPIHHRFLFASGPHSDGCHNDLDGLHNCNSPVRPSPPAPAPLSCRLPPSPAPYASSRSPPPSHYTDPGVWDDTKVGGGGGRRDHRRLITLILVAVVALTFLSLVLFGVSIAVRRRHLRRRQRQALFSGNAAAPAADAVGGDDPEGGGGIVHHVWYIRTVGLDEAAIDSIAVTQYRADAGLLGAADCSVCLGEFEDGELVRLLPKCGHAFHVPCIDTWLRAHVNCPLCRSDVLDPTSTTTAGGDSETNSNPPAEANANATAEQAASDGILEHEEEDDDQEAPHLEVNRYEQFSSPELLPQLPDPLLRNARRAASMDAAIVSAVTDMAALQRLPEVTPEEEQSSREKRLSSGPFCGKVSSSRHLSHVSVERSVPGGGPRSFFSRHHRARSLVLPL